MRAAQTIADLSDDEIERRAGELVPLVGAEAARRLHWRRRLAVAEDGQTLLEIKRPRVPRSAFDAINPRLADAPWNYPHHDHTATPIPGVSYAGLQAETDFVPLADAVEMLTGPGSPEAEVARRQRLLDAAFAEAIQAQESRIEAARAAREKERAHKAARPARWAALSREAKILYTVADAHPTRVEQALVMLAKLSESGSSFSAPASTFEPS